MDNRSPPDEYRVNPRGSRAEGPDRSLEFHVIRVLCAV